MKLTVQIPDISIVRKMFQKMIADQFSGQIPDLDKFRTWTNSGRFPDKLQHPETIIFWNTFRTMEMSGICTVSFLDKFRTNSRHSFFIGSVIPLVIFVINYLI